MKLVRGSEVRERYYTLSYSWNQSGDYVKNEHNDEYIRNDQGKHQIIFYRKRKAKKYPRGRTRTRVPVKPRFVKFERLVQQICKDFGVRYIWWDQYCIDQSNPEEKRREIMQMHSIYKNAYCALVLIPELDFTGHMIQTGEYIANTRNIMETEWVKRVWTLEEAFMSKRMLFVGRNVHMWSHTSDGNFFVVITFQFQCYGTIYMTVNWWRTAYQREIMYSMWPI
ncbi:hypothetical protein BJV82DRAFT_579741 [Fennellomyces sp. T-0311]|nr:hypothetical protein BJV82DRAFT_579741 [Fennellomyces sp. T-0311]